MKKFISGFICGGLLFGGVTVFAADLKGALFNINSVEVDGTKITVNSKNKPLHSKATLIFPAICCLSWVMNLRVPVTGRL